MPTNTPQRLALVLSTKTIHWYPAYEQCNLDDVKHNNKEVVSVETNTYDAITTYLEQGYHKCKICFPIGSKETP